MKSVSAFFSRVIPHVVGCTDPLAHQAIVDSAISFCDDSMVLRERLDIQTTVVGQGAYELDAPAQQQIARVLEVWVNGVRLSAVAAENVNNDTILTGSPTHYYITRTGSEMLLNLYPAPAAAVTLSIEVATRPKRDATSLEDDLFNLWMDAIVAGALGRLMSTAGASFANPQLSLYYTSSASRMAGNARVEGSIGRVQSTQRVAPRAFI